MKKIAAKKSLELSRQTVRVLTERKLELANGGWNAPTGAGSCTGRCTDSCGCDQV